MSDDPQSGACRHGDLLPLRDGAEEGFRQRDRLRLGHDLGVAVEIELDCREPSTGHHHLEVVGCEAVPLKSVCHFVHLTNRVK